MAVGDAVTIETAFLIYSEECSGTVVVYSTSTTGLEFRIYIDANFQALFILS